MLKSFNLKKVLGMMTVLAVGGVAATSVVACGTTTSQQIKVETDTTVGNGLNALTVFAAAFGKDMLQYKLTDKSGTVGTSSDLITITKGGKSVKPEDKLTDGTYKASFYYIKGESKKVHHKTVNLPVVVKTGLSTVITDTALGDIGKTVTSDSIIEAIKVKFTDLKDATLTVTNLLDNGDGTGSATISAKEYAGNVMITFTYSATE